MALNAADLQKRHELEGAPDPFPPFADAGFPKVQAQPSTISDLDTASQSAFPSLSATVPAAVSAKSAWGPDPGPRIKPSVIKSPVFTDSFTLSAIDLSNTGKDGRPASLGEVIKQVMAKYKVKVDASANQKARQTTFHIKAETQKELDKAKRSLLSLLSPVITLTINAPVSTIASIIGPKGATLKQIRDQTSVRVDIPPKDALSTANGNGHANGVSSGHVTPVTDEDEEPTVPVTLTGPQPLAYEAQALLNQIISSKTSKLTQRVRDIPAHILPFVKARRAFFVAAADGSEINLSLNSSIREITVVGDRDAVLRVVEVIKGTIEGFRGALTSLKLSLPKRQHRLLTGKAVDEILAKSRCAVVVSDHDDPSEEVVVWGQGTDLPNGLSVVMERANSQYIHEFPLPGPVATSRQILSYMFRIQYPKTLATAHSGVSVFFPTPVAVQKGQGLNIDIVGEKPAVDGVVRQISELIGKLIGATRDVSVDWLLHRVIMGKNGKKLKQFHEVHNVQVIFPNESAEQSTVVLVYDPLSPAASPSPDDKKKHLDDVEKELIKLARDAADVKSHVMSVEKRWHEAIIGQGGTTLNAIIGEEKTLSIKVGAEVGGTHTEDVILVRGASADVDRAVKEIEEIVENAKNDEIVNSYSSEFEIDREFVGRIVGSHGVGINKLRDQLGVKVDVSDESDEKGESGKKKKAHAKAKVKITGRKENVEEAKRRILSQVERLADETSEILKVPSQYHSSLIGQGGKYAIRLEEKYSVKITFPRQTSENGQGKTREQLQSDEVLIKGGKKGVANAKSELLEALEFEKESNNVLTFTVPTRSVARILGKGGASINEIKDTTNTQIDVEKPDEDGGNITKVTVRGTKKAIAMAKTAILAIADQVPETTTITLIIESKFHRTLIGTGGQGLRDLILRCDGPADSRLQAGLIKFPRQGESSDEVKLRGTPQLVDKLKAELEKQVAILRDRVTLGVQIPSSQHRSLIGRGGQHLNDLQSRLSVQVQFPGSRSYAQVGEPENLDDLVDVSADDIVKVSGSKAAAEVAVQELKDRIKSPSEEVVDTVSVPLKYHHTVSQQGNLVRTLRSFGVQVDQSGSPSKSALPARPSAIIPLAARIDEADDASAQFEWEVVSNHGDAESGSSTWTLKARDQAGLERAKNAIKDAIERAEKMSHVGFLTLPDRSMFPRIVGTKGSNVARLRDETGTDITVSRDTSTIVIIGSENTIVAAKDAILKMVSSRPQRRRVD